MHWHAHLYGVSILFSRNATLIVLHWMTIGGGSNLNAPFADHTPKGWKGTCFSQKDVVPEKEVRTDQGLCFCLIMLILLLREGSGVMGQSIVGHGMKAKAQTLFSVSITV